MTFHLREANAEDAAMLAMIHAAAFDDGWSEPDLAGWLVRPDAFAVVAAHESGPVAFGLALMAGDDAEVLTLACLPAARRCGAGRGVLRELDVQAAQRGLRRWVLEVARNNLAAIGLYKAEGFVEIGVRKHYYRQTDGRVDAIAMARPVGIP